MKSNARWIVALAMVSGAFLNGAWDVAAETKSKEANEATAMMSSYEAQMKAATEARAKDATWKPACTEEPAIQVGDSKKPGSLKNFCLNAEGNILACFVKSLRVYSPKGELLKTLALDFKPSAVCVTKDGSIFAAGEGKVAKLDAEGKVLASAASPVANEPVSIGKDVEDMVKEQVKATRKSYKEELERMKTSLEKRRADVTGLAATDQDIFIAVPAPNDFSFRVYRFDHELKEAKMVVDKLRGCCGQMDVQAHAGNVWIPHNARHMVESHDRDGKELSKFGTAGRVKPSDFGGCCEPKNLRVLSNGEVLAAESGPPTCIKRFSADGKFLGVVALVKESKGDCVRCTVEVSPDGKRYYMLDTTHDAIRVFAAKS